MKRQATTWILLNCTAKIKEEKDLGVIICADLKQVSSEKNKQNSWIHRLDHWINSRKIIITPCIPHLECVQFWSPYHKKIRITEWTECSVQVSRWFLGCEKKFKSRLDNLDDLSSYLRLSLSDFTPSIGYKLVGKCFTLNKAEYFSSTGFVNIHNNLPIWVVESRNIDTFMSILDEYFALSPQLIPP